MADEVKKELTEEEKEAVIKEQLEKYKNAAPAGKKFRGIGPRCSIHGNISKFGFPLTYTTQTKNKDGKVETKNVAEWLCLGCLTDYWKKLVDKKEVGTVAMVPIYLSDEEAAELEKTEVTEEK